MLELAILGFLADGAVHGYVLRRRIAQLSGYTRPVSDGSLYPAIGRLVRAGLLDRRSSDDGSTAARRQVLSLTDAGRAELLRRLRQPDDVDVTDPTRWFTVLAFLSLLPDTAEQHALLRRRLAFLEQPTSFFYDDERPLTAKDVDDPYRRGMLLIARATSRAERSWLHQILDGTEAD